MLIGGAHISHLSEGELERGINSHSSEACLIAAGLEAISLSLESQPPCSSPLLSPWCSPPQPSSEQGSTLPLHSQQKMGREESHGQSESGDGGDNRICKTQEGGGGTHTPQMAQGRKVPKPGHEARLYPCLHPPSPGSFPTEPVKWSSPSQVIFY